MDCVCDQGKTESVVSSTLSAGTSDICGPLCISLAKRVFRPESQFATNAIWENSHKPVVEQREIAWEFIDGSNEAKFERLVKEEKIKTVYKRRYSSNDGSISDANSSKQTSPNKSDESEDSISKEQPESRSIFSECFQNQQHSYFSSCSTSPSLSYVETDPLILARRQKQIDYGKNTVAYDRYMQLVPRSERNINCPHTPNKHRKYSRRAFDGLIKVWRKKLHDYDPPEIVRKDKSNHTELSSDAD